MILVAIGANLPDAAGRPALATCVWARAQLMGIAPVVQVSRWYRTAPVPASDQPDYINGVARLDGGGDPRAVLDALHRIENIAGRVRGVPNAARVLDLDLLAIDGQVVAGDGLILPHPRIAQRGFVLLPLSDVAPGWIHPVLGATASVLLARIGHDGVSLACKGPVD